MNNLTLIVTLSLGLFVLWAEALTIPAQQKIQPNLKVLEKPFEPEPTAEENSKALSTQICHGAFFRHHDSELHNDRTFSHLNILKHLVLESSDQRLLFKSILAEFRFKLQIDWKKSFQDCSTTISSHFGENP